MSKKMSLVIGVVIVVAAVAGGVVMLNRNKSASTPHIQGDESHPVSTTLSQIQAKSSKSLPACIAVDDGQIKDVSETSPDQTNLVNSVTGTIIDVPAGTTVDVHIKTQDVTDATGSSIYRDDFGSYNFIAKKVSGNWAITDLAACQT